MPQLRRHCRPTALTMLHLLIIEPLPIYTFYISFLDVTCSLVAFLETWYYTGADVRKGETIGDWVYCALSDVFNAFFTIGLRSEGKCLQQDETNLMGIINLGCVLLCCITAGCPVAAVLRKGELDICRGGYMACKWEFEHSRYYQNAALLLLLYTFGTLLLAVLLTSTTLSSKLLEALMEAFVSNHLASVVMLVSSAVSLSRVQDPRFDYRSDEFKELRFARTWRDVLWQSNSAFGQRLENAALLARAGRPERLEAMLSDKAAAGLAMHVCSRGVLDDCCSADGEERGGSSSEGADSESVRSASGPPPPALAGGAGKASSPLNSPGYVRLPPAPG